MSGALERRIRAFVAAMDAGDVATMADLLADDVVYDRPVVGPGGEAGREVHRGKPAVVALLTERFATPRATHRIGAYADRGEHAFVEGVLRTPDGSSLGWVSTFRCTPRLTIRRWLVLLHPLATLPPDPS